jgi:CRISPR type III-A-associated RAMP protein Csm5
MQTEYFKLDILSPVHVGTGDQLDPMNYLMRREPGGTVCHVLDTWKWAGDYPDSDELSDVFSGGNIPAMRSFLADKIDPDVFSLRRIAVNSERVTREYEQKMSDRGSSHQLLFNPHMTVSEKAPLIPGSSIKGAFRTAVIDWLDREKRLGLKAARAKDSRGDAYRKCLERVLGPISNNAFKQIKVGDVAGYTDSTLLVEPLEMRRKQGKSATPKNKCEVMPSRLLGNAGHCALYARISIGKFNDPADNCLTLPNGPSWSWAELARLVNEYFFKRFKDEKTKFYELPNFSKARPAIDRLEAELNGDNGQMVLRLGHYSQVESVTVTNNRPWAGKGRDDKPKPYGTTRTLADGRFPFGWVRLTPCSETEYLKGAAACEVENRAIQKRREALREKVLIERRQKLEQAHQREELARQEAEAEARRQAALAAISPEQRLLVKFDDGSIREEEVNVAYKKIDEFPEDLKPALAAKLKAYWIANKKWSKKEVGKKRWKIVRDRNQKIDGLIGE